MNFYAAGCLVCGKPLKYFDAAQEFKCEICGQKGETNAVCGDGHYVCDKCHAQKGYDYITNYTVNTASKNPLAIASEIMKNALINMHGPEHHYLVAAALLAAYKNAGGVLDLTKSLTLARERAKKVPGGICGFWGSCGAGIGAGIFVSVATGATPLSQKEWRLANLMTSEALADISRNGGPRCCKRNTYLSQSRAVAFAKEHLGVEMETFDKIICQFFHKNDTCRQDNCLFFPN